MCRPTGARPRSFWPPRTIHLLEPSTAPGGERDARRLAVAVRRGGGESLEGQCGGLVLLPVEEPLGLLEIGREIRRAVRGSAKNDGQGNKSSAHASSSFRLGRSRSSARAAGCIAVLLRRNSGPGGPNRGDYPPSPRDIPVRVWKRVRELAWRVRGRDNGGNLSRVPRMTENAPLRRRGQAARRLHGRPGGRRRDRQVEQCAAVRRRDRLAVPARGVSPPAIRPVPNLLPTL